MHEVTSAGQAERNRIYNGVRSVEASLADVRRTVVLLLSDGPDRADRSEWFLVLDRLDAAADRLDAARELVP